MNKDKLITYLDSIISMHSNVDNSRDACLDANGGYSIDCNSIACLECPLDKRNRDNLVELREQLVNTNTLNPFKDE